tara:strand:+ start:256 stop:441 length:186 start_codon:yes stop_codon:yes gene_type:complete
MPKPKKEIELKTRKSFTDWVLEGQEDFENELLDRGFDEDDISDSIDLDMDSRYPLYKGGKK